MRTGPETACAPGAAVCHAATNACLATKEFAGSPSFDMRISQLTITKPDGLTAAKPPRALVVGSDGALVVGRRSEPS